FRRSLGAAAPGPARQEQRGPGNSADRASERAGDAAGAKSAPAARRAASCGHAMNWLDLAVIGVIVLSAVFAFARGFVREALSIVAWLGAAAITLYGFNWVYAQVDPRVHNPLLSQVISGFGLFVVSLV